MFGDTKISRSCSRHFGETKPVEVQLSLSYEVVALGNKKIASKKQVLVSVNTRLFFEDIEFLKRAAAEQGLPWQIELRLLVHRAVKGEQRDVLVLKEQP